MSYRKKILFVCMGNICRSPAAEGVMKKLAADQGLSNELLIDSAGTIGYHQGEPADQRMRSAAKRRGYELIGRSRQLRDADFSHYDLILALDRENLRAIRDFSGAAEHAGKIKLFGEFLPGTAPRDVPDPYYGGPDGFELVLDLVEQGCRELLRTYAGQVNER